MFQAQADEGAGESSGQTEEKEKMSCSPALSSAGLLCPSKKSNNPSLHKKASLHAWTLIGICNFTKPLKRKKWRKGKRLPISFKKIPLIKQARPIWVSGPLSTLT